MKIQKSQEQEEEEKKVKMLQTILAALTSNTKESSAFLKDRVQFGEMVEQMRQKRVVLAGYMNSLDTQEEERIRLHAYLERSRQFWNKNILYLCETYQMMDMPQFPVEHLQPRALLEQHLLLAQLNILMSLQGQQQQQQQQQQ